MDFTMKSIHSDFISKASLNDMESVELAGFHNEIFRTLRVNFIYFRTSCFIVNVFHFCDESLQAFRINGFPLSTILCLTTEIPQRRSLSDVFIKVMSSSQLTENHKPLLY